MKLNVKNKKKLLAVLFFLLNTVLFKDYIDYKTRDQFVEITQRSLACTVTIHIYLHKVNSDGTKQELGFLTGSGVFITSHSHILTVAHLFTAPYPVSKIKVITNDGNEYTAQLLSKNVSKDLALLYIPELHGKNTPYLSLAKESDISVGEQVIVIGSPLGLDQSVSSGIVSYKNRDLDGGGYNLIQTNAAVNPGNSGGPMIDLNGRVIGIISRLVSILPIPINAGLGFAVSPDQISEFLVRYRGIDEAIKKAR